MNRIPALLTLLIFAMTFYLGMDRYFGKTYVQAHELSDGYAEHIIIDSLLFLLEAAIFFGMSRNLAPVRWEKYCRMIIALLVIDVIWCSHAMMMGPTSCVGWIIWDIVLAGLLGGLMLLPIKRRPLLASWSVFALNIAVTAVSYVEFAC
jgi:hypothetical protein